MTTTIDSEKSASVAERSMGFGLRHAQPPRRLRPARPDPDPQAGRAGPLPGHQERLPHGDRRRAHLQGGAAAGQTGAPEEGQVEGPLRPHPRRRAADVPGGGPRLRRGRRSAPPPTMADAACATARGAARRRPPSSASTCSASPRSSAASCTSRRPSTSVLIGEALAHGDMGIAYAALAPGAVATAIGLWGSAEQEATYLPAFTGEDVPAAALAILEPRPLFDPLKLETTAKTRRRRLGPRRRQVAAGPGQGVRAVRDRRRGRGHRPGPLRGRVRRQRPLGRSRAGDGPAPRRHRPSADRRSQGARPAPCSARASASRRTTSTAINRSRIAWCGARDRHRPGGARLRHPLRQRPPGLRRTDLQPPGRRLRGLRHRHRERRDAARHLPGGQPAPTAARASTARRRSPAGSAPRRGCRSAPRECSCSAATASSRSTRSSAGTGTCEQRA